MKTNLKSHHLCHDKFRSQRANQRKLASPSLPCLVNCNLSLSAKRFGINQPLEQSLNLSGIQFGIERLNV